MTNAKVLPCKDHARRWQWLTDTAELQRLLAFWEDSANEQTKKTAFYKEEARRCQELLGRVISQTAKRYDNLKLTNYP
ncbi:MAG: hypothetical protein GY870_05570 [archaeon]|nr:hypothetical protein [archaeon]